MSRIGKKPVVLPEGVTVEMGERELRVRGKNAELGVPLLPGIKVEIRDNQLIFTPTRNTKQTLSNWGTMRSLTQNAVLGASQNFSKTLIIEGVGYRANLEGDNLILNLGYSHPIKFPIPPGIKIVVEKNTIVVAGADKQKVGQAAAKIRSYRKPEPYKGKGIRYSDEVVRRKAGKKATGK